MEPHWWCNGQQDRLEWDRSLVLVSVASNQRKYYEIGICCLSTKHAALRSKNKDWLARNHDNVSEWSDIFICGLVSV